MNIENNIIIKILFLLLLITISIKSNKIQKKNFNREFRNKINNLEINDSFIKKDLDYILNYRGTLIEPEWEWVKNISFVYTWVDGSDVNLSNIKSKYNGGNRNVNNRDRSADELLYSLRSLKKYLPWHNGTIFIVTDNQIPDWLNTENNDIKIINHNEIIPKYINPTFDSSTIECFLDKIPGLTEIFIYLNDDFFFNNYVHPAFFFSSNLFYPKIFRTNMEIIDKEKVFRLIQENNIHKIYGASVYFTYKIIKEFFDNNFTYYHLAHCAYVCYRSFFEPFRQFYQNELKVVYTYRFRCAYKPVTLYLYQMLLLYLNQKLTFNSTSFYREKLTNFKKNNLFSNSSIYNYSFELVSENLCRLFIKFSSVSDDSVSNYDHFNYLITNRNILIYNINDKYNSTKSLYEFTQYMMTRYPENNKFEKINYITLEKEYLNKLEFVNETLNEINGEYLDNNKRTNYFHKMFFNEKNLNYIKDYLNEKSKLSIHQNISKKEQEEIDILFNYDGNKLEPKWNWIKNISIVYIIIDDKNINQLKYSLRSIERFLPWFLGTIFIILNKVYYNLSWINLDNHKIKIIYAKDIVSKKFYGNYSKEIIELYLDKIPSVTERFILLSTNHFFNHFIHPRFFFSEDFYPKYNLSPGLSGNNENLKGTNEFIFKTYEVIKKFFGNNYITNYRFFIDAPISLYRDLFRPVRKLYKSSILESINKGSVLLPIYLLSTYNIYGTAQIYFPNYLVGFGEIRNNPPPSIKRSNTILYYGFDITSEIILNKSILTIEFFKDVKSKLMEIKYLKPLFFSFKVKNNVDGGNLQIMMQFLQKLYDSKSFFEK